MSSFFQQISSTDLFEIRNLPGNSTCIDCGASSPLEWASVKFATVFCLECSGIHRSLGTHIDFVRSLTMDEWDPDQLKVMKIGGNDVFKAFLKKYGVVSHTIHNTATNNKASLREHIAQTYASPAAQLYKQVLKARLEGKPEPTELPKVSDTTTSSNTKKKHMRIEGIGSGPPPSKKNRQLRRAVALTTTTMSVLIGTAAMYFWLYQSATTNALSPKTLSVKRVQTFYDSIGGFLDVMSIVEDEPRKFALQQAQLNPNSNVLDIGVGTGRTAEYLQDQYGPVQSYTGLEVSKRMVELSRKRLEKYQDARVVQGNALNIEEWPTDSSYSTILAFYVLDIWSPEDIQTFLSQARRVLQQQSTTEASSGGQIVLVSITDPDDKSSLLARAVMGLWTRLYNTAPMLVGGCRPIDLVDYLEDNEWNIIEQRMFSIWGYTSKVVVACHKGEQ